MWQKWDSDSASVVLSNVAHYTLKRWFSEGGSWTSSISISWELVGNVHSLLHLGQQKQELGEGPSSLCLQAF